MFSMGNYICRTSKTGFISANHLPHSENGYSSFLSDHGGSSNAFTGMENTNYFFELKTHAKFKPALDMFSAFFKCPLFTESATDRELQAVDSEHSKNIQDDFWRLYQVEKTTSNPGHPFHKFATGDRKTLEETPKRKGINVRDALLDFHAQYYSANRMSLVLLGRETLEELEGYAQESFSGVENKHTPFPSYGKELPITKPQQQRVLKVKSNKEIRHIEVGWVFPPLQEHYKCAPNR